MEIRLGDDCVPSHFVAVVMAWSRFYVTISHVNPKSSPFIRTLSFATSTTIRKPKELLETDAVLRDEIPVIRRFTGGGTVIVDQGTIFVSFICNKDVIPGLQSYPRPIMSWSSLIYKNMFQGIGEFGLRENDYVLGNRKFGGNAQSITKNRWVHHTSFLWDYEVGNMGYLKMPTRVPEYRQGTIFVSFICNKDAIPGLQSYPRPIMSWSSLIYKNMFQGIGEFGLRENDYVLGNRKFGGNAQSITKNRERRKSADELTAPSVFFSCSLITKVHSICFFPVAIVLYLCGFVVVCCFHSNFDSIFFCKQYKHAWPSMVFSVLVVPSCVVMVL
ncbi:uncharacterized protein LOC130990431 [Salvia miltiorrhiza]|uniref:uncharacterized protein LOC130990431 n=1 Tax=Salvia miltiorrhiza TaxID=226208 RepID=UPI0025AD6665|nr:uncharacterized protein LOC130990431 [Salvia miltiorrhiza]